MKQLIGIFIAVVLICVVSLWKPKVEPAPEVIIKHDTTYMYLDGITTGSWSDTIGQHQLNDTIHILFGKGINIDTNDIQAVRWEYHNDTIQMLLIVHPPPAKAHHFNFVGNGTARSQILK